MSHFTNIKTCFQSLSYMEKALNKLNINNTREYKESNINLVIPQSNGHDIRFEKNKKKYELIVDISFWEQPYSIEGFIDNISQQYASEVIINESKKTGFRPTYYNQNSDGSNTLILERWDNIQK